MSKIIEKLKGLEDNNGEVREEDLEPIEIIEEADTENKRSSLKVYVFLLVFIISIYAGYKLAIFFTSPKEQKVLISKEQAGSSKPAPTKSSDEVKKERKPVLFTGTKEFERYLNKKAEEDLNNPVALNNLAVFYFEKNDYERALKLAQKAVSAEPENPFFWNTLGIILTEMNLLEEAEKCFKRSIEMAPEEGVFYYNIATLYDRMGNISLSTEKYLLYLTKSDKINPKMIDYVREKFKKGI